MNLWERIAGLLAITVEEAQTRGLDTCLTDLQGAAQEIAEGDLTDEAVATLGEIADTADAIRLEQATIEEAAQAAQVDSQAALDRILGRTEEGDEGTLDGEPPAEGEAAETTEAPAEGDGAEAPAEGAEADQPELVTAAAPPAAPAAPVVTSAPGARRVPAAGRARPARREFSLVAAADVPNVPAGREFRDMNEVGQAAARRWNSFGRSSGNMPGSEQVPIATMQWASRYPAARRLGMDAARNMDMIERVVSAMRDGREDREALVAAGGLCAPLTPRYDDMTVGTARRPVADSLPGFMADRGGITYMEPPVLTDIDLIGTDAAVGFHTVEDDEAGTLKPIQVFTCTDPVTVELYAITQRVRFGNFLARTFPERVASFMDLVRIAYAGAAERRLLTRMCALSTAGITTSQVLGTARDVIENALQAGVAMRDRQRMEFETPLHVWLPGHVRDQMRADLVRELPGSNQERLATANAYIDGLFRAHNINVTWTLDVATGDGRAAYTAQAANSPLAQWKGDFRWIIAPEGSFIYLDGGELDLGVVRDSTLNAQNNFENFSEGFENVAFVGPEALCVTSSICPDGSTAATADTSVDCTQGS